MSKLETVIRIIIAISIFYIPGLSFPAIALVIIITTLINKNQIVIVGTHCELPKDKYEITNEKLFNLIMKIRGIFIAVVLITGWILMMKSIGGELTFILTLITATIAMLSFNNILERYYTEKEELA